MWGKSELTLKGSGELSTTAQQEQALLVLEELGTQVLDGIVELQDLLELLRNLTKTFHDFLASLLLGGTVFTE